MRDEVMKRAREMLAAEYEAAGYRDEAAAFRAGDWTCFDHPAVKALTLALSREEEIRTGERERCAHLCDEEADALDALPNPFRRWSVTQAKSRLARLLASAIRDGAPAGNRECYRHVKRGTIYDVIGEAELQAATIQPHEGNRLVVYRGEDGRMWARLTSEFHDGRFEPAPPVSSARGG